MWLWTSSCRRKRCRHAHAPAPGEVCDALPGQGSGQGPGQGPGQGQGSGLEAGRAASKEVLQQMRSGTLDPSKALPAAAAALASAAGGASAPGGDAKARLARLCEQLVVANHPPVGKGAGQAGRGKKKGSVQGQEGQPAGRFESIKLNADGTKLIFRGAPLAADAGGAGGAGGAAVSEAYVFVAWEGVADGAAAGEAAAAATAIAAVGAGAVVQCEDEGFRQAVIAALAALAP